jgi:hypothetical protein
MRRLDDAGMVTVDASMMHEDDERDGRPSAHDEPMVRGPEGVRMDDASFHAAVAALLGAEDAYRPNAKAYRTRWNDRKAGNGRYPGFGIVRRFGDEVQIAIRRPIEMQRNFATTDEAIEALTEALGETG